MKRYRKSKIYFDGSHYMAIPCVRDPENEHEEAFSRNIEDNISEDWIEVAEVPFELDNELFDDENQKAKEIFEVNYNNAMALPTKSQRLDFYYEILKDIFPDRKNCDRYVQFNFNRKFKNFIFRQFRLIRKINMLKFDYFCTFTYDSAKMNEDDFRKKLSYFLQHRATRNEWEYIGVWERGDKDNRLHFHFLLKADEKDIPGNFAKKRVWSSKVKKMKTVYENDYIRSRFGINDFSPIDYEDAEEYLSIVNYLLKYIEKSGERIVYSRGLKQFFLANIDEDNDVLAVHYNHSAKYVLFDDFEVFDDNGVSLGVCSKELLNGLKKTNI